MKCVFRLESSDAEWNNHKCIACGYEMRARSADPRKVHRVCGMPDNRPPGWGQKLANFSIAAIKHVYRGSPSCADEEIADRHAICKGCHLFEPEADNPEVGRCSHASCGCKVYGVAKFVSKLAWRDQTCPLEKWPELPLT